MLRLPPARAPRRPLWRGEGVPEVNLDVRGGVGPLPMYGRRVGAFIRLTACRSGWRSVTWLRLMVYAGNEWSGEGRRRVESDGYHRNLYVRERPPIHLCGCTYRPRREEPRVRHYARDCCLRLRDLHASQ